MNEKNRKRKESVSELLKQPGKKRRRRDPEYRRSLVKQSRITGAAYKSSKGKEVAAKKQGPPCK